MARFNAVTWKSGDFYRTASVLSFEKKAARDAYRAKSTQRIEPIAYNTKVSLLRNGYPHRLVLWDKTEPTKFIIVA